VTQRIFSLVTAAKPAERRQGDSDDGTMIWMVGDSGQGTVRIERKGRFGLLAAFRVLIDGVDVGVATRNQPCDFAAPSGVHRVQVKAPSPSNESSNIVDVDLAPSQIITLVCQASFPIHKAALRALTMGARKPQVLFLADKEPTP
jgi:hypothetical protein